MFTDKELKAFLKPDNSNKGKQVTEPLGGRGSGSLVFKVRSGPKGEFYFKYNDGASRKLVKVGNYKSSKTMAGLSLVEARGKAQELSKVYREVKDVKGVLDDQAQAQEEAKRQREIKKALGTFEQLVQSYVGQMRAAGKPSAREVERSIDRSVFKPYPKLKMKKAKDVTTQEIKGVLARMIENGITTQTNRVRSYLLAAFNHGMKQENNPRIYLDEATRFSISFNPVAPIPRQTDFEKAGDTVISESEIKDLWHNLQKTVGVGLVMSLFIRFALAVGGQRIQQILSTPWERFDLEARTMEILDSKGKGSQVRPHVVPLNDLAMAVLIELKPITGASVYPFAGGSCGSSKNSAIRADSIPLALSRYRDDHKGVGFKAGDIRRTCKTIMARHGIRKELRDRIHNHSLNDIATKHYDRHDYLEEKRAVMAQWNDILKLIIEPKDNVTLLKKQA
ncbi:tyrosine-type recombinase/integrase [Alkalimarinus alittae]|uniref:Tyr recombinase domain-containing protein n=1 Tax=Alkalimarinus alittae TaxID=2961619 RepID=A0ABY6N1A6_9ALTE|nr:site-specific integrase [Alkalimarinus alittae]UZE95892.1 hypothetical protein NKI27_17875 [Alkalimarinus alittae]